VIIRRRRRRRRRRIRRRKILCKNNSLPRRKVGRGSLILSVQLDGTRLMFELASLFEACTEKMSDNLKFVATKVSQIVMYISCMVLCNVGILVVFINLTRI
jgi:hypothetical protein